jgi:hypothetical protein
MLLSGATEAYATCSKDEGGIDIYGRIPLRVSDERLDTSLLQTTILNRLYLYLGQCKCYGLDELVEPAELREFVGAAATCLDKYEHNASPPSHRVPEEYYCHREMCISIFFATGGFTEKAKALAEAEGIILADGRRIAQFLVHHRIAVLTQGNGSLNVDKDLLDEWASGQLGLKRD